MLSLATEQECPPCAVCGTTSLCLQHILTGEQLDHTNDEREASRELAAALTNETMEEPCSALPKI